MHKSFALTAAVGLSLIAGRSAVDAPRFMIDPLWPKPLPNHWLLGSATGVAVDGRDHVYVINLRTSFNASTEIGAASNPPTGNCCLPAPDVLEFDAAGNLVASWGGPGQGYDWPTTPAGIAVDDKGNIWIGGSGVADGQVLKFSSTGKFLLQIGKPMATTAAAPPAAPPAGGRGDTSYGGLGAGNTGRGAGRGGGRGGGGPIVQPPGNSSAMDGFGAPARFSFDAAANEVFVADGYRNRRIAVIDATTGTIKRTWGAGGNKPDDADMGAYAADAPAAKQFRSPTCAAMSKDGMVYVCDRGNDRIQVFKKDGSYVKEQRIAPKTLGEGSVWDIAFSRDAAQKYLYVADGMNNKVYVVDRQTLAVLTSFGDGGRYPGQFLAVHSIATDSKGNIYTTEHYQGKRLQKFTYQGIGPVTKMDQGTLRSGQ